MTTIMICDLCSERIKGSDISNDAERVRVTVSLGWEEDMPVGKDYHRKCARTLTVPAVYAKSGLLPL